MKNKSACHCDVGRRKIVNASVIAIRQRRRINPTSILARLLRRFASRNDLQVACHCEEAVRPTRRSQEQPRYVLMSILFIFALISIPSLVFANTLHVDRGGHKFYVLDNNGKIIYQAPAGIGRGGLKKKTKMNDYVTPTGNFEVGLILHKDPKWNKLSEGNKKRYKGDLKTLFDNMNNIDFDKNGKPDRAYGTAYIGLDSKTAVTGPKLSKYGKTPYWYSIAIHGTPDKANIGKSNSGGCVHLSEKDLNYLIENKIIQIGTSITIDDGS